MDRRKGDRRKVVVPVPKVVKVEKEIPVPAVNRKKFLVSTGVATVGLALTQPWQFFQSGKPSDFCLKHPNHPSCRPTTTISTTTTVPAVTVWTVSAWYGPLAA